MNVSSVIFFKPNILVPVWNGCWNLTSCVKYLSEREKRFVDLYGSDRKKALPKLDSESQSFWCRLEGFCKPSLPRSRLKKPLCPIIWVFEVLSVHLYLSDGNEVLLFCAKTLQCRASISCRGELIFLGATGLRVTTRLSSMSMGYIPALIADYSKTLIW